jgi:hypothetical protein
MSNVWRAKKILELPLSIGENGTDSGLWRGFWTLARENGTETALKAFLG